MQSLDLVRIEAALLGDADQPPTHFVVRLFGAEKDHGPSLYSGAEPVTEATGDGNGKLQSHRGLAAAAIPGEYGGVTRRDPACGEPAHAQQRDAAPRRRADKCQR